uniref:DNA-directed DNA polymerase n=1 Tax=viral metagenome TaxID=1070528 RepID=A0A6C0CAI5_9ZZZZ
MNKDIIDQFNLLINQIQAEYVDAQTRNDSNETIKHKYRLQSLKKAVQVLRRLDFEIEEANDVAHMPGIGKGTLARIDEILKTGQLNEIKKPKKKISDTITSIQELKGIFGIGDKKAQTLVTKYNIKSVAELKQAYNKKKIDLDNNIRLGLKYYDLLELNIPRDEITKTAKYLTKVAQKIDKDLFLMICGSYRRGRKTSGDIDVLLSHPKIPTQKQIGNPEKYGAKNYINLFVDKLSEDGFLLDHLTDKASTKYMGFSKLDSLPVRRIDVRFVPYSGLAASMLSFTGPRDLNIAMRREAIKRNMILNEYGLYKEGENGDLTMVKTSTEEEIFNKLGMEYMTPEERDSYEVEKKR